MKYSETVTLVLAILIAGCVSSEGPEPGAGIPEYQARIELTIGVADGDGADVFGRIGGLLELPDGRIVVSDVQANEIRVFSESGEHLFTFGREGDGPGDLGSPCCLALGPEGLVWVREASNGRYSAFRVGPDEAEFVRALTMQHGAAGLWAPTTFDDEGLLVDVGARPSSTGEGSERARFHLDDGGEVVRTEVSVPAALSDVGSHRVQVEINGSPGLLYMWQPFASRAVSAHGPGERRALALTGVYEIETWTGPSVDTLRGNVTEGPVLTAEERKTGQEAMESDASRGGIRASELPYDLPDRRTPLAQILYDDLGRLWVELSVTRDSARVADNWNPDGQLAGRVTWPYEVRLGVASWIGQTHALAVARDELGVQRVVRLRWD
jgi:hypothetical protein